MRSGPQVRWTRCCRPEKTKVIGGPCGTTETTSTASGRAASDNGRASGQEREGAFFEEEAERPGQRVFDEGRRGGRFAPPTSGSYRQASSGWASGKSLARTTELRPNRLLSRSTKRAV